MVLASLKHHTARLHLRVESAVDLPRRVGTLGSYSELLGRLLGFYEPFEERLAATPAARVPGLELASRFKVPLLVADLEHLGHGRGEIDAFPRCLALPAPRSLAQALGCLYVLEGSTLGGRFIRQHVERSLGLSGPGVAFFSSYGDDLGRMWKTFGEVVESAVIGEEDRGAALEFAAATFEAFEEWLAPDGPADG